MSDRSSLRGRGAKQNLTFAGSRGRAEGARDTPALAPSAPAADMAVKLQVQYELKRGAGEKVPPRVGRRPAVDADAVGLARSGAAVRL